MVYEFTNEQCRNFAISAAKLGKGDEAMRWYNSAAAGAIGHAKTDSYIADRNAIAKQFDLEVTFEFATDEMSIREVFRIMKENALRLEDFLESRIYGRDFKIPLSDEENAICTLIHYASKLPDKI